MQEKNNIQERNIMQELNVLIVGVGGQGTLLASVLLGNLAMEAGYDVKLAEVHGMAQRGGSVVTHVRMSKAPVKSPLIEEGGADVLVAFELLEGFRWLPYLKKGGELFINNRKIKPMPVIMGKVAYPEDIPGYLAQNIERLNLFDADVLALEAGNIKSVNTVLMGALSTALPFSEEMWLTQIENNVKPKFVEMNKKAFLLGREVGQ
jgi:indolepyruvate ferredoxin oxidoreductase, beta subunit